MFTCLPHINAIYMIIFSNVHSWLPAKGNLLGKQVSTFMLMMSRELKQVDKLTVVMPQRCTGYHR